MSKDQSNFFIGWSPETPKADRRFFLTAGLALTGAAVVGGGLLAGHQNPPGVGAWDQADVREWRGVVTAKPYAMLRTSDIDGTPRTVLLSCLGKCGVAARIGALEGRGVVVTGSLIQRGKHAMLAVAETMDWIKPTESSLDPQLAFPDFEPLQDVSLSGEILDSKCWFGAMRPSEGKVHKACAALCIRGGIPPAFFARGRNGREMVAIMTNGGEALGEAILPYVGDPLALSGQLRRRGDLLLLDTSVESFRRV